MSPPRSDRAGPAEDDVRGRVAAALDGVDGLCLMVPLRAHALRWAGREAALAISVDQERVEIRLVASRLPLPPLLDEAAAAIRTGLAGTGWERVPLRLVVGELTTVALPAS